MRRVLVDECLHPRLVDRLRGLRPEWFVTSVRELGWAGTADGRLVTRIQGQFEVFVTLDRGFAFQHDLRKLDFGIVILRAINNQMTSYERMLGELLVVAAEVAPAQAVHVRDPELGFL